MTRRQQKRETFKQLIPKLGNKPNVLVRWKSTLHLLTLPVESDWPASYSCYIILASQRSRGYKTLYVFPITVMVSAPSSVHKSLPTDGQKGYSRELNPRKRPPHR